MEKSLSRIGGYEGLVNTYYKKIWEEVECIKNEYDYQRDSHCFAHWFLVNIKGFGEKNVAELITDDYDDWAIDAINIDNDDDVIELYQFKLPTQEKKINSEISQDEILKFLFGYRVCSSGKCPERANEELKNKIKEIVESEIFNYRLIYVSYTSGLGEHARYTLDEELEKIKNTGNQIEWELYDKKSITDRYYSNRRKTKDFEIKLGQYGSSTGIMTSENSSCFSIHASLEELAKICTDHNEIIFDENVRLFHGSNNNYNKGIIQTAKDEGFNFHLYNNGIVILSTKVSYIDTRKILKIQNPRVVNGCQTMNSLVEAKKEKKKIDGYVHIKAIEIKDPLVRQNISIYLNSQTEIKDSYLISNLPIIMQLEEDLTREGFFLERQANQVSNIKKRLGRKDIEEKFGKGDSQVIKLELAIQTYATFFESLGPVAKLNKAKLFNNRNNLEKIFRDFTANKVLLSYKIYSQIMDIITSYRRYKRNSKKDYFLKYLAINASEIKDYSFMNTADIFLLSLFSKIVEIKICSFSEIGKQKENKLFIKDHENWEKQINLNFDEILIEAIDIIKSKLRSDTSGKPPATLTKSQSFHRIIMTEAYNRYNKVQL